MIWPEINVVCAANFNTVNHYAYHAKKSLSLMFPRKNKECLR